MSFGITGVLHSKPIVHHKTPLVPTYPLTLLHVISTIISAPSSTTVSTPRFNIIWQITAFHVLQNAYSNLCFTFLPLILNNISTFPAYKSFRIHARRYHNETIPQDPPRSKLHHFTILSHSSQYLFSFLIKTPFSPYPSAHTHSP